MNARTDAAILFVSAVAAVALALVTPSRAEEAGERLLGRWGGERLNLVLDGGGGQVESDCASGTITGPVIADRRGAFSAPGTFAARQPGPQAADADDRPAARYSGDVKDDTMTLTVTPAAGGPPLVFRLRRGVAVKLVRCL